jgi:hypothetical protein
MMAEFAAGVKDATTKNALIELLRSSMEETKKSVLSFGDIGFEKTMTRFDGKQVHQTNDAQLYCRSRDVSPRTAHGL